MPDITTLAAAAGYLGIAGIIFAETGLFVGFFLPGDSLLFAAGILASYGLFDLGALTALTTVAAILGDSAGYWTGMKLGPLLFKRAESFWFSARRVEEAERFFERYGPLSVVLARFVPVARTFVPPVAGVARMRYRTFLGYNIVGALLWAGLIPVLGYYVGNLVPDIDRYILPVIGGIVLVSVLPVFFQIVKQVRKGR